MNRFCDIIIIITIIIKASFKVYSSLHFKKGHVKTRDKQTTNYHLLNKPNELPLKIAPKLTLLVTGRLVSLARTKQPGKLKPGSLSV